MATAQPQWTVEAAHPRLGKAIHELKEALFTGRAISIAPRRPTYRA